MKIRDRTDLKTIFRHIPNGLKNMGYGRKFFLKILLIILIIICFGCFLFWIDSAISLSIDEIYKLMPLLFIAMMGFLSIITILLYILLWLWGIL